MRRVTVLGLGVLAVVVLIAFVVRYKRPIKDTPPPVVVPQPAVNIKADPFVSMPDNPHWMALLEDYENYVLTSVQKNLAAGVAVAVLRDTTIYLLRGYGISNYESGDSTSIHSIFRLGSVSKCFASVLTGKLVDKGVVSWDDKVTRFLPGFALSNPENTGQLTLRHLLSHTSGLPYHAFTDRIDDGANMDTLIYHLRDLELTGPPGELYSYQNVAYSITSNALEAATGKTYSELMDEEIFGPLRMEEASMTFDDLVNDERRAKPHFYSRSGWKAMRISTTYYNAAPAGGINASISDMARFIQALNGDDLLSDSTREEIFKPFIKATARNRNFRRWKRSTGSYYGLGWRVLTFKDDTLAYHGGFVNGYRGEVAIRREDRIAVCVLVNSAGYFADNAIPEFFIRYQKKEKEIKDWEAVNPVRIAP